MIGRLRGYIIDKQAPQVMIDVHGVGYEVTCSMNTIFQLPSADKEVVLLTHFVVREDAQQLFGFIDNKERSLFRALIKVNGVGPKLAITILSSIMVEEFVQCVSQQDVVRLTKVPGIGKKTAERLIVEMRDRLVNFEGMDGEVNFAIAAPQTLMNSPSQEAIAALVALGYKQQEADKAVKKIATDDMDAETLIRAALKANA
jgi:holliday junction DNA helicase RuvA